MKIEVSIGEIVDKLSILQLKSMYIKDEKKLKHILEEKTSLEIVVDKLKVDSWYYNALLSVNSILWHTEEEIRAKGLNNEFDGQFMELAKKIYIANNACSMVKSQINIKYKSKFVEQKSYKK